ncbi:prickle planar cell polarity protein 3-like isoform X2 [Hydractinia symbiolongicarpus]|uniref:prickle planar cell polarity protein 3-like isoform X2 n=1 Tax=Hydractinia symbiolongicarpus TaxID=13093 RepID=UPI00254BBB6F|nr:prickle planar cell polarity protein 3-like isoform X2 [Hydractinia symbiolongicarpus]
MAEWKLSVNTRRKNSSSSSDEDEEFPEPPSLNVGPIAVKTAPQDESIPATTPFSVKPGSACLNCKECSGLSYHKWRKTCTNCSCDRDEHEVALSDIINDYKMNRLSLHDMNENITTEEPDSDEYLWVPPGIDDDLVEAFMCSLHPDKVPSFKNHDGIKYHNKQLMRQIPLQDSNFENITTLSSKEKYLLDAFKRERDAEMATAKVMRSTDYHKCSSCRRSINAGDVCVNAVKLGDSAVWHPSCFSCATCEEMLADLIYCFRDGQIFCLRHHAEQIKPRCCMCDELIFGGEYIRTDEKSYHSQHFVCCQCERELSGEQHLVDQGLPICISCYDNKYASICHMCHKTIGVDEEDVIYDDEHWHDHCLICNLCNCRLSGTSFVIKDDKFLCSDCYQKTDDKRCGKCGKGFEPGAKRLELKGEYWHDSCFVCDVCKDPITSKRFIHHEGQQVCCPCFDANFAKRCEKCKEILREGGVACGGAFYHRNCFACENCNTSIANQAFQQKDGKRYCTPCYKDMYAKVCSACGDYIVNGEFYTVDTDNWHKDCFRCENCKEILVQQSFAQENGKIKLICEKCS